MAKKILVIDDDRVGTALMVGRLSRQGFDILTVVNGQAGLDCAINEKPDLILLDIEMPEMNGYTFILELKKRDDIRDIPVIMTTAHEENRPIFDRRGIKHFLTKPVNFDQLFTKIAELIGPA